MKRLFHFFQLPKAVRRREVYQLVLGGLTTGELHEL